ncbi:MAG TPA: 4-(cytidine 5'-diphospho)-2-C-methyl-D-erythritol kinase [Coriobacteriia bacterium]|nr:4-(cytidine 5'-diphospho)-2-C-methyl-D-erythritol kinase [Coriobacteriia bacterium]
MSAGMAFISGMELVLAAPAKLNLMLGITPQIVDGKHELKTVFTTIDLADTLTFTIDEARARSVTVEVTNAPDITPLDIPTEKNIVYKAVSALEESTGYTLQGHLHIRIDKRIPHEAGLAGGSTDAAATLKALAELWGIDPLSPPVLVAAAKLGADVTFFLHGGCALMGGGGEKLLKRLPKPALDLVLVRPDGGVSTKEAYATFDADPQTMPDYEPLVRLLEGGNATPQAIAGQLANNLAPAATALLPAIRTLTDELSATPGVYKALLTGSGSTVFAVCGSAETTTSIAEAYSARGYWAKSCTT